MYYTEDRPAPAAPLAPSPIPAKFLSHDFC
jgi:hypothetical protein